MSPPFPISYIKRNVVVCLGYTKSPLSFTPKIYRVMVIAVDITGTMGQPMITYTTNYKMLFYSDN